MDVVWLCQKFLYHACAHAIVLINMMATKALQMNFSYCALFDKPPSLQDLKIFGSVGYPYLRHYNHNKL